MFLFLGSSNQFHLERDANRILDIIEDGNLSDLEEFLSDGEDMDTELANIINSANRIGCDKDSPDIGRPTEAAEVSETDNSQTDITTEPNVTPEPDITPKNRVRWRRTPFVPPNIEWNIEEEDSDESLLLTPAQYFSKYLSEDIFEAFAVNTNLYALQKDVANFKNTTAAEVKSLFGLHIFIGCLKFPRVELFWSRELCITIFPGTMSRDRFFKLRNNLHIVNELEIPQNNTDRLYKVRPLYEAIRNRCLELSVEESICIDEQTVPFRGHLNIKQYIKGKPNPWGVKIFVLCGKSGLAYDFLIYQGKNTGLNEENLKKYGFRASVVLHLAQQISLPGHKLFYDNYFLSFHLLQLLKSKQVFAAGTIRTNRFQNPPLLSDKDFKNLSKVSGNK